MVVERKDIIYRTINWLHRIFKSQYEDDFKRFVDSHYYVITSICRVADMSYPYRNADIKTLINLLEKNFNNEISAQDAAKFIIDDMASDKIKAETYNYEEKIIKVIIKGEECI